MDFVDLVNLLSLKKWIALNNELKRQNKINTDIRNKKNELKKNC